MRTRIVVAMFLAATAGFGAEAFRQTAAGVTSEAADLTLWWKQFRDPELDLLVDRAIRNNIELRIAASRVVEARAMERAQRSSLFPSLGLAGAFNHIRGVDTSGRPFLANGEINTVQMGLDASWEADLFGANRKAVSAAAADARSAEEARRDVLVTVTGEVARAYAELRGLDRRITINQDTIRTQAETLRLTKVRSEAGLATELDVARQSALLSTTEAVEPALRATRVATVNRLAVLLGLQPSALAGELEQPGELPAPPAVVAAGLPSDLLARRPDIRRAQADVVAASARLGAARSELFPKFTITGLTGRQATGFGGLTLGAGNFFAVGPAIQLPVFTGGRIRANIAANDARVQEARGRYESTMLRAVEEVENALSAYGREQERRDKLVAAADASRTAVELARELYSRGLADFLSVLDAQRAQYADEDALAQSQTAIVTGVVTLYKSLGGGWQ